MKRRQRPRQPWDNDMGRSAVVCTMSDGRRRRQYEKEGRNPIL